eukprot:scaffold2018_cov113-Cylindrotheca_fusiformis.AAC.10
MLVFIQLAVALVAVRIVGAMATGSLVYMLGTSEAFEGINFVPVLCVRQQAECSSFVGIDTAFARGVDVVFFFLVMTSRIPDANNILPRVNSVSISFLSRRPDTSRHYPIIMWRSSRRLLSSASSSCRSKQAIAASRIRCHQQYRCLGAVLGGSSPPKQCQSLSRSTLSFASRKNRAQSTAAIREEEDDNDDRHQQRMTPFVLADIGEGIAEVEVLQWFVQVGDDVNQFDRICEVQSDKATVEITSRYDGRIASLEYQVGDMAKVGQPLLFLQSEASGDVGSEDTVPKTTHIMEMEEFKEEEPLKIPSIASKFQLSTDDGRNKGEVKVLTTPAIRKLAKENDLDLSTIVGSGPKGRVLKGDVLTVLRERGIVSPSARAQSSANPTGLPETTRNNIQSTSTSNVITSIDQAVLPLQEDTRLELRGYNRLMVQTMVASLQIPHMVYADELNVSQLMAHKKSLPFLPYLCKAVSKALSQYPLLNSSFQEDNSVSLHKDHNLGIAMDTPRGLIVPVIRQVQDKSIAEIQLELQRLKELAQTGTVPTQDLQGATFTLSNIGAIGGGGTYMSPIVTPPQVAIGAFGKIQRLPRFASSDSSQVEEAHIVTVSWAGDHRVIDGATMARFHAQVKEYMQEPITILKDCK